MESADHAFCHSRGGGIAGDAPESKGEPVNPAAGVAQGIPAQDRILTPSEGTRL